MRACYSTARARHRLQGIKGTTPLEVVGGEGGGSHWYEDCCMWSECQKMKWIADQTHCVADEGYFQGIPVLLENPGGLVVCAVEVLWVWRMGTGGIPVGWVLTGSLEWRLLSPYSGSCSWGASPSSKVAQRLASASNEKKSSSRLLSHFFLVLNHLRKNLNLTWILEGKAWIAPDGSYFFEKRFWQPFIARQSYALSSKLKFVERSVSSTKLKFVDKFVPPVKSKFVNKSVPSSKLKGSMLSYGRWLVEWW